MLDNNAYNLLTQLSVEHRSLWRIKDMYRKDATDCGDCTRMWEKMAQDKEDHIRELVELLKTHL